VVVGRVVAFDVYRAPRAQHCRLKRTVHLLRVVSGVDEAGREVRGLLAQEATLLVVLEEEYGHV